VWAYTLRYHKLLLCGRIPWDTTSYCCVGVYPEKPQVFVVWAYTLRYHKLLLCGRIPWDTTSYCCVGVYPEIPQVIVVWAYTLRYHKLLLCGGIPGETTRYCCVGVDRMGKWSLILVFKPGTMLNGFLYAKLFIFSNIEF